MTKEKCQWCDKYITHPKAIREGWGICYPCGKDNDKSVDRQKSHEDFLREMGGD